RLEQGARRKGSVCAPALQGGAHACQRDPVRRNKSHLPAWSTEEIRAANDIPWTNRLGLETSVSRRETRAGWSSGACQTGSEYGATEGRSRSAGLIPVRKCAPDGRARLDLRAWDRADRR